MKYTLRRCFNGEVTDESQFLTTDLLVAANIINNNVAYVLNGDKNDPDAIRLAEMYRVVIAQTKTFLESLEN